MVATPAPCRGLEHYDERVSVLRATLNDATIGTEAAAVLTTLIDSVFIYPNGRDGPEAEMVAKVADLIAFATNDNAARKGGGCSSAMMVAGTGFDRCRTSVPIALKRTVRR